MQIIHTERTGHVVRLDRGDKWPDAFCSGCSVAGVRGAFFYGLGAVEDPEVAYYDLDRKKYLTKKFKGKFEIVSIVGNISKLDKSLVVHSHAVFSGPEHSVFGGHFVGGSIGGTLELYVSNISGAMQRKADPKTGLNILV